jgi:hypothetical protein
MAIVMQLPLCVYELQGLVICVDDCFLPQNVMLVGKPTKWNTFLCHKWDTFILCRTVSHCDIPLDAFVEYELPQ